jgi:cobalt-zinc-cadmium efflux system outer membrane protein
MKTYYLLLLTFILTSVSLAGTQSPPPGAGTLSRRLSLDEVSAAVLAENPAIKEALAKWDAQKKRVTQEAAWDDLKVSGMSRVARFVSIPPNAFTDQSLSVEQSVPLSGKNRARARIAVAEAIVAFQEVRRQQLDALTKARAAYFRLANAYTQLELNEQNLVSLRQIAELGRAKYEVGSQTAAEVLTAETEASKLLEARRDLENLVARSQSELNVLMNRDAFAPLGLPERVAANSSANLSERLRSTLFNRRPEIAMARARVDAQTSNVQLARRAWIPDPSLTIQGQRYNSAAQTVSEVGAGVSFSLPWGNARKYSAGVSEARDQLAAAQFALERTENESLGLLRDALQRIETARHHVELFHDQVVPQARQAFEASQFAYQAGKGGFADWIGAQRNLRDLEAIGRDHLSAYQTALAELESIVGADLGIFHSAKKEAK